MTTADAVTLALTHALLGLGCLPVIVAGVNQRALTDSPMGVPVERSGG